MWSLGQQAEALAPLATVSTQVKPNGDEVLLITLARSPDERGIDFINTILNSLGFSSLNAQLGTPRRFQITVNAGHKTQFLKKMEEQAAAITEHLDEQLKAFTNSFHPGRLNRTPDKKWKPGRLVYTGNTLDLAMTDSGLQPTYFLPILVSSPHGDLGLNAGERAYCRGGQLFVDKQGRLCTVWGPVDAPLEPIPEDVLGAGVLPDGKVMATLLDGSEKLIGTLSTVQLEDVQGDGSLFTGRPVSAQSVSPVLIQVGHLEYPTPDPDSILSLINTDTGLLRIFSNVESSLMTSSRPWPETKEELRSRELVLAFDIPMAKAHLEALGLSVKSSPGRATILVGARPEEKKEIVTALMRVLDGLNQRMAICQQNYNNEDQVGDNPQNNNPYRRKIAKLGKDGELLMIEDQTAFKIVDKPKHPAADPTGKVKWTNVSREVEVAEFNRVEREYLTIRAALHRIEPDIIFPDPPAFKTQ